MRKCWERAVDDIVPLRPAAMLSGGIDSTALTALLRQRMDRVCTFSVDYEGNAQHFRGTSFQPERDAPYIRLAVRAHRASGWLINDRACADGAGTGVGGSGGRARVPRHG